ncbi:MAG: M23 family metallopeptidase [Acidobacteria bacterium]|nr:M23 family metallopeptidase [Acidobacteriota bacterium]
MIEIQLHSGNLRRRVRHLVLGRGQVAAVSAVGSLFLFFMLVTLVVAPSVIRRTHRISTLRLMKQERDVQLARLREHVAQLESLEHSLDEEQLRVEKLARVYGIELPLGSESGDEAHQEGPRDSRTQLTAAHSRESHLVESIVLLDAQLARIAAHEAGNPGIARAIPSILPLPQDRFVVLSVFGQRVSPYTRGVEPHPAIDLAAAKGSPIYATADGVVTFAGRPPLRTGSEWWRLGNIVVIDHDGRYVTVYGHCNTVGVRAGQHVKQGSVIATVGDSGWASSIHLHYEIRGNLDGLGRWEPVDPRLHVLNYQWPNEQKLLIDAERARETAKAPPLPSLFVASRR